MITLTEGLKLIWSQFRIHFQSRGMNTTSIYWYTVNLKGLFDTSPWSVTYLLHFISSQEQKLIAQESLTLAVIAFYPTLSYWLQSGYWRINYFSQSIFIPPFKTFPLPWIKVNLLIISPSKIQEIIGKRGKINHWGKYLKLVIS